MEVTLFSPKTTTWTLGRTFQPLFCDLNRKTGQNLRPVLFSAVFLQFFWVLLKLLSGFSSLCLHLFRPVSDLFCSSKWEPSPLGLQYPPLLVEEFLAVSAVCFFRVSAFPFSDLIPHSQIPFNQLFSLSDHHLKICLDLLLGPPPCPFCFLLISSFFLATLPLPLGFDLHLFSTALSFRSLSLLTLDLLASF